MPDGSDLRCKSRMYDLSPFDETLYLDADTIVLGRLDADSSRRSGTASPAASTSARGRDATALRERGDMIEYDTGVVFFSKDHEPRHGVCGMEGRARPGLIERVSCPKRRRAADDDQ
jgi:hypothetical protein